MAVFTVNCARRSGGLACGLHDRGGARFVPGASTLSTSNGERPMNKTLLASAIAISLGLSFERLGEPHQQRRRFYRRPECERDFDPKVVTRARRRTSIRAPSSTTIPIRATMPAANTATNTDSSVALSISPFLQYRQQCQYQRLLQHSDRRDQSAQCHGHRKFHFRYRQHRWRRRCGRVRRQRR